VIAFRVSIPCCQRRHASEAHITKDNQAMPLTSTNYYTRNVCVLSGAIQRNREVLYLFVRMEIDVWCTAVYRVFVRTIAIFTARCYVERVRPSSCLSVSYIGWSTSKIISWFVSQECCGVCRPNIMDLFRSEYPEILAEIGVRQHAAWVPVTSRSAAFCTDCRRLNRLSVMPLNRALQ